MHLLIPYVDDRNHPDPAFDEFTYGDVSSRAHKLKSDLHKGDFVFFHIGRNGKKYITAYYVVDRVLDTLAACRDETITTKYKNPHILEFMDYNRLFGKDEDAILFGDPAISSVLDKPLLFDRRLAEKLSLGIKFPPNRTETQSIGSATRAWRHLTAKDVQILLDEINTRPTRPIHDRIITHSEAQRGPAPQYGPGTQKAGEYVDRSRINELRAIQSPRFDMLKLTKLCEELNDSYANSSFMAVGALLRAILDHVPPIFECRNFSEVANNYNRGGKSFRQSMQNLENSARKIADGYLHSQIRVSEILPNKTQINFAADLDFLLAEIIRVLKK